MSHRDPVFRGCTRPAMFLRAPMVPVILLIGLSVLVGMLGLFISVWVPMAVVPLAIPVFAWMRAVARTDDQKLNQLILRARLRTRMYASLRFWGAITFVPIAFKRR